jgi:hypothetical protein
MTFVFHVSSFTSLMFFNISKAYLSYHGYDKRGGQKGSIGFGKYLELIHDIPSCSWATIEVCQCYSTCFIANPSRSPIRANDPPQPAMPHNDPISVLQVLPEIVPQPALYQSTTSSNMHPRSLLAKLAAHQAADDLHLRTNEGTVAGQPPFAHKLLNKMCQAELRRLAKNWY